MGKVVWSEQVVKVSDLLPADYNPRSISDEQLSNLRDSLDTYGMAQAIACNVDLTVIGGHQRLEAAKILGWTDIKIVVPNRKLTELECKDLNIRFNGVTGNWESGLLTPLLIDLDSNGFDIKLTGLDKKHIKKLDDGVAVEVDTPDVRDTEIKVGDLFLLGDHRLLCGDASSPIDMGLLMGADTVGMVFTDPPYGVNYEQGKFNGIKVKKKFNAIANDDLQGDDLRKFISNIFGNIKGFCVNSPIYVCSPSMIESFMMLSGLQDAGFHIISQLVWVKNQFILGRGDYHWRHEIIWYGYSGNPHYWCGDRTQDTIWNISKDAHGKYAHPTQKPVELVARALKNSSDEGDIVLDVFAGSGTTLISCEQLNRKCYSMELIPGYCQVIIDRWEQHTGKKAVKIDA